jgi:hypothetical protein
VWAIGTTVFEGLERLLRHEIEDFLFGDRFQPFFPQLAPVVVMPDNVILVAAGGQCGGHLFHENVVGNGVQRNLDAVGLAPFLEHLDRFVMNRAWFVGNLKFRLGHCPERCGGTDGQTDTGGNSQPYQAFSARHSFTPFMNRCTSFG